MKRIKLSNSSLRIGLLMCQYDNLESTLITNLQDVLEFDQHGISRDSLYISLVTNIERGLEE